LNEETDICQRITIYHKPWNYVFPDYWEPNSNSECKYRLKEESIPDALIAYFGSKNDYFIPLKGSVVLRQYSNGGRVLYAIYDVMSCRGCFYPFGSSDEKEAYKKLLEKGSDKIEKYEMPPLFSLKNIDAENCLTGDCSAVYVQNAEVDLGDGLKYVGELRNGRADGKGKIIDEEGRNRFICDWKDGLPHGDFELFVYTQYGYIHRQDNGRLSEGKPVGKVHFAFPTQGYKGTWDINPVLDYALEISLKEGFNYPGEIELESIMSEWEYKGTGFLYPFCLHSLNTNESDLSDCYWINRKLKEDVYSPMKNGKPIYNKDNVQVPVICEEQ